MMYKILSKCRLFNGLGDEQIEELIGGVDYSTRSYSAGDVIALQGGRLTQMVILVEGNLCAETTDQSQNVLSVEHIASPALIAPSFLFAEKNMLPATISARTPVSVISFHRDEFTKLLRLDAQLLTNFLEILSGQNTFISEHVVYLTYKTIKGKFANYLLGMVEKCGELSLRNNLTQREMADMFGVTRPALARAIGELAHEGAIYVQGKQITVLFIEKLRQYAKRL